jgi:molybdenum cofactor cytidylyltransferase
VVLAAGASSRFFGTKQLAEIGGRSLVERVIESIPTAVVREVVVVLGHDAGAVAKAAGKNKDAKVVLNSEYRDGLSTSIRAGIRALSTDTDGAMLLLADQPFVTRALLRRMVRVFEERPQVRKIVAAAHGELVSPPVIFSREYFGELMELEGDNGAKSVIDRNKGSLRLVKVGSRAVLADVDTRDDVLAARRSRLKPREARQKVRVDLLPPLEKRSFSRDQRERVL